MLYGTCNPGEQKMNATELKKFVWGLDQKIMNHVMKTNHDKIHIINSYRDNLKLKKYLEAKLIMLGMTPYPRR